VRLKMRLSVHNYVFSSPPADNSWSCYRVNQFPDAWKNQMTISWRHDASLHPIPVFS
jgi:hypothetical protein